MLEFGRLPRAILYGSLLALVLAPATGRAQSAGVPREAWDAVYVGETKVGSMHLWIKPVKDSKGRELVNVRIDYNLSFLRGKDTAQVKMLYGTIETPEGQVLRLDTRTQASGNDIRTYGDVSNGVMKLVMEVGGQKSHVEIPWGDDVRGPYGSEMSLSRQPLAPGEARDIKTYIPDLNKVCTTHLKAVEFDDVPLGPGGEPHRLLRVESRVDDDQGRDVRSMAATLWVDPTGQIMKSHSSMLGGMYTYRTTQAGAESKPSGKLRLLEATILTTPRPMASTEQTRQVVYRIKGSELATLFPNDQRQTLTQEGEGQATLVVTTDSPESGQADPTPVADEYMKPSPLINSNDAQVIRHAKAAVGRRTDPWEKAVAIQEWVYKNIRRKNFSTAFAPAEEVARTLSGDCTEHGVLAAAMCRAAGVPSRCVVGLVYAAPLGGFGFHMWNEVHVNGRWVAIDSTFNQSQVDATHLKLSTSSLSGVAPFDAFLPVLDVLGSVKIEPIEVR